MSDWDYNFGIKDFSKTVNNREYRAWRLTGIFHETRLDSGKIANRTMGSYVRGKTKKGRDSIAVRGFWGDIVNSPYFAFGNEIYEEPERTRFLKEVNYQRIYSNADISEYIIVSQIKWLEEMEKFDFPFERLKHILGDDYNSPAEKAKMAKKKAAEDAKLKKKLDVINEVEEPMIQEITDEEEKKIKEEKKRKQYNKIF